MNYEKLSEQLEPEVDLVQGAERDELMKGRALIEEEGNTQGDTDEETEHEDEEDDGKTENHEQEEQIEQAPSISVPYDAKYSKEDVIALFNAIAPFWQKNASDVPDLHPEKLFLTLTRVVDEWRQLEEFGKLDKDLQALLCLSTSLDWFSKSQISELDNWAGEVARCSIKDWTLRFPEDELRRVTRLRFGADVSSIRSEAHSSVSVEYTNGDFGDGTHNGCIYLDYQSLRIHDHREEGKVLWWTGRLPKDANDLGECLLRSCWHITWDGEDCE